MRSIDEGKHSSKPKSKKEDRNNERHDKAIFPTIRLIIRLYRPPLAGIAERCFFFARQRRALQTDFLILRSHLR
jgi:hypothetical protein